QNRGSSVYLIPTVNLRYPGTTTTFTMDGKEYTLYVRDNINVVTEVETGVRASFDNSTYTLKVYENSDAQPIVIQLPKTATYASNATKDNEYAYSTSIKQYNNKPYTFWQIQIPDNIKYTYETNNSSALIGFRNAVDTIKSGEDSISSAWGSTVLVLVLGIIAVTPIGTLATAIAAALAGIVGASGIKGIVDNAKTIKTAKESADSYFHQVVPISVP
ncbi:MAG: geobacillin-26 family protein, partial [Clostridium sp.]|nr:geobacillin-26 family protein [Clostridium sp.]